MFKIVNELTPPYLRELFEYRSTGYNLRNSENTLFVRNREPTMVNEVLVTTGQCCGMCYLKMYEQYMLT